MLYSEGWVGWWVAMHPPLLAGAVSPMAERAKDTQLRRAPARSRPAAAEQRGEAGREVVIWGALAGGKEVVFMCS